MEFLCQAILPFSVLLILTAAKYPECFPSLPPRSSQTRVCCSGSSSPRAEVQSTGHCMSGGPEMPEHGKWLQAPESMHTGRSQQVFTTSLVGTPSYKMRILDIDFTELKLNLLFIIASSEPSSKCRKSKGFILDAQPNALLFPSV